LLVRRASYAPHRQLLQLYPLEQLFRAACLVGERDAAAEQIELLNQEEDGLRYWAAVGLSAAEPLTETARNALGKRLDDASPVVRMEAAFALSSHGNTEQTLPVLAAALTGDNPEVALHAARALELRAHRAEPLRATMRQVLAQARNAEKGGDMPMFIRFGVKAALEKLDQSP